MARSPKRPNSKRNGGEADISTRDFRGWESVREMGTWVYSRTWAGHHVAVEETPDPPRSGIYRYRVHIDDKRLGTKDFREVKQVIAAIKAKIGPLRKNSSAAKRSTGKAKKRMTRKNPTWTRAYINKLPDSAFLYVEAGGKKDEQGKTVPRSLRHFPVRDLQGRVSEAHARNAIARISQSTAKGLTPKSMKELQKKARALLFFGTGGDAVRGLKKPLPKARPHAALAANTSLTKFVPWKGAPKKNAAKKAPAKKGAKHNPNSAAVWSWLEVLKSKLTQYDRRLSTAERKRGHENIYRLSHYLKAAQEIEKACKKYLQRDDAKALAEFEASMKAAFAPGFPPVKNVLKQLAAHKASGKMPSLVGNPKRVAKAKKKPAKRNSSGPWMVYWESGIGDSKKFHKHNFTTKATAYKYAAQVSDERRGGYITVHHRGLEVAEFYKGKQSNKAKKKPAKRNSSSRSITGQVKRTGGFNYKDVNYLTALSGKTPVYRKDGDVPGNWRSIKSAVADKTLPTGLRALLDYYGGVKLSENVTRPAPHMWVIAKDSTGRYIVSIGDPRESGSTLKRRFANLAELKDWIKYDMPSAVSLKHIVDKTGKGLLLGLKPNKGKRTSKHNPRKAFTVAAQRHALLALYKWATGSDRKGNPYTVPAVRNAITALGGNGYDLPAKAPTGKVGVALHNLVKWATGSKRVGNPHAVLAVRLANKALGGDGYDLLKKPSKKAAVKNATINDSDVQQGTGAMNESAWPHYWNKPAQRRKAILAAFKNIEGELWITASRMNSTVKVRAKLGKDQEFFALISSAPTGTGLIITASHAHKNNLQLRPDASGPNAIKPMRITNSPKDVALGLHRAYLQVASMLPAERAVQKPNKERIARLAREFRKARAVAAKYSPRAMTAKCVLDSSIHVSPRAFAMTKVSASKIEVRLAPELAFEGLVVIRGVLNHEFGHVLAMVMGTKAPVKPPKSKAYDAIERHADKIAEKVFGANIYYDERGVETLSRHGKRPRPAGLR